MLRLLSCRLAKSSRSQMTIFSRIVFQFTYGACLSYPPTWSRDILFGLSGCFLLESSVVVSSVFNVKKGSLVVVMDVVLTRPPQYPFHQRGNPIEVEPNILFRKIDTRLPSNILFGSAKVSIKICSLGFAIWIPHSKSRQLESLAIIFELWSLTSNIKLSYILPYCFIVARKRK